MHTSAHTASHIIRKNSCIRYRVLLTTFTVGHVHQMYPFLRIPSGLKLLVPSLLVVARHSRMRVCHPQQSPWGSKVRGDSSVVCPLSSRRHPAGRARPRGGDREPAPRQAAGQAVWTGLNAPERRLWFIYTPPINKSHI